MTTTARSFLPSRLFAVLLCLALVPVLIVGRTAKAFAAPLTVTVIIDSILQIDDPEDGFDDGSCWGDFEFTVNFGGQQTVSPEFSIDPGPFERAASSARTRSRSVSRSRARSTARRSACRSASR